MPPLNALKSFEAAARRGSFQAAAQELFVTPSAVSHQLKQLEAFLGLELFIRQPKKIVLTQAGEDYFLSVQRAFIEIDRSTQQLISAHQSGELHLSAAPAFLSRWLLPRISSFYEANPDVMLELSSTVTDIDFDREETDMAVYFGRGDWKGVDVQFLRHHQQVPVCSPRLLEKTPVDELGDLLKHPLLCVNQRQDEWTNWFKQANVTFKEKRKRLYFSSGALTTMAAINGLGIALADPGFVSDEIALGKLVTVLDTPLTTNKSFYLVYEKNRAMTYAMKAFQLWLLAEIEKEQAP